MLHRIFSQARPCTYTSPFHLKSTSIFLYRRLSSQRHKIRMLILSDTHGDDLKDMALPKADVVLHCGDLTNSSHPAEMERTLAMLRAIDAPVKLAIPGNHDFGLEPGYWRRTRVCSVSAQHPQQDSDGMAALNSVIEDEENDADAKASWELLHQAARRDNIFLLPQGTHNFALPSDSGRRVRLRLFASPLTPRRGNWGFQYDRSNPHKWAITPVVRGGDGEVDVVMTHGPPRGIRDGTGMGQDGAAAGAGCAGLLSAIERTRPRLHCFGHIHGAWGAEVITWKREMATPAPGAGGKTPDFRGPSAPIFSNLVDSQRSGAVASLSLAMKTGGGISDGECRLGPLPTRTTQRHRSPPRQDGCCCAVDISPDGEHAVEQGLQTLFVNAAVELRSRPPRMPWLVDIDLPVAGEEDIAAAAETMYRLLS